MIYYLLKDNADGFRDNALKQHRELVAAFRARDGEKVRKIACEHLRADLKMYTKLNK